MLLFLAAEAMFFAGLVGAFLVFRVGSLDWPPEGQPRIPMVLTIFNTGVLFLSSQTMRLSSRAARRGLTGAAKHWLSATTALGCSFLVIQGYEWLSLLDFGLTFSSGPYGFTFYTIIGAHGAHVVAGVSWLVIALFRVSWGADAAASLRYFDLCGMYWYFVVGLWLVLFGLVYVW